MSVFKKLKGTFQIAQQDFVDGLRALTLFDGHLKSEQVHHIRSKNISLNVGADLLHEYQAVWSSIQNETKMCSKKAEEVDALFTPMFSVWDDRTEILTELEQEIKSIPSILSTLKELHTTLESVQKDFSVIESSMSELENLCEELELKKAMDEEIKKLNLYRSVKEKETENIKVNIARTHAKKMQDIESSKSLRMKERAEAFTSAFKDDVNYYKTHGRTDTKLVTEFPKVTSLSQIEIEEDNKDLDTFLGPQTEEEQGMGAEEMYIEDDYITGCFSVKEDLEGPDGDEDLKQSSFLPEEDDYYSNDENENNIRERGDYPESYLVKNENFDMQDGAEGETVGAMDSQSLEDDEKVDSQSAVQSENVTERETES